MTFTGRKARFPDRAQFPVHFPAPVLEKKKQEIVPCTFAGKLIFFRKCTGFQACTAPVLYQEI